MQLYAGTSGYAYKEWKGAFYPADLHDREMLRWYASVFRTVEINNTFYRMPKTAVVASWAAEVSGDFKFVLKASQRITHFQRLKDAGDTLGYLLRASEALGPHLGVLLFQLPPNLKKDVPRLRDFLALLPADRRAAFEFRHASWFDDEVFGALGDHRAALCIAQEEGELEAPFVPTAGWGYLRLRRAEYSDADLEALAARVRAQEWSDAFVFFKHEDSAMGPKLARRFLELAGEP